MGLNDYMDIATNVICSDMSALNRMSKLENLWVRGANISGDISLLPASLRLLTNTNGISNCYWNNSRPSSSNIFGISGKVKVNNIDNMLNDFNNCVVPSNLPQTYANISISGTRTSASDAAVSGLKNKGYKIELNGVVL